MAVVLLSDYSLHKRMHSEDVDEIPEVIKHLFECTDFCNPSQALDLI